MAGQRGGRRPGAGRKASETKASQLANRAVFLAAVSEADVRGLAAVMVRRALTGDVLAAKFVAAYCMGDPAAELTVSDPHGDPLEIVITRDALGRPAASV